MRRVGEALEWPRLGAGGTDSRRNKAASGPAPPPPGQPAAGSPVPICRALLGIPTDLGPLRPAPICLGNRCLVSTLGLGGAAVGQRCQNPASCGQGDPAGSGDSFRERAQPTRRPAAQLPQPSSWTQLFCPKGAAISKLRASAPVLEGLAL
ncbi:hypothetical protein HJG60_010333 [Phyllostomus discolor]|uniref:Uncharacterized protein n=1 Tax=Phyllostomus discolor TaxID=89673 RepID=A0A834EMV6_9CHIR|nr:hypothetical protein HJG60_010333 [Phyllostomus discolor]